MLDNTARNAKDRLLTPMAESLSRVHPNVVTVFSLIAGILAAVMAWQQLYWLAILMWMLNRFLDSLDGTMARINQQQSDFGGYFDIMIDFTVYAVVPIGVVLGQPSTANFIALAVLLATFYINSASWMYLAALLEKQQHGADAQGEKTSVTMPRAIIGGLETGIMYLVFMVWPGQLVWWFGIMSALVMVSIIQRLIWAQKHI